MKILVTAFDAFGGEPLNPAQLAVEALPTRIGGADVVKLVVPTVFGRAFEVVAETMDAERPAAVLCVGQAGGRAALTPERVAINVADARLADNAGAQPVDEPVVVSGPAAYLATVPIKAMVQAIREVGLPAAVSNSAGTFVCNHLLYSVLHHAATTAPATRAGFIHVPYVPSQVVDQSGTPSLSLVDTTRGLEAAIRAVVADLVLVR